MKFRSIVKKQRLYKAISTLLVFFYNSNSYLYQEKYSINHVRYLKIIDTCRISLDSKKIFKKDF